MAAVMRRICRLRPSCSTTSIQALGIDPASLTHVTAIFNLPAVLIVALLPAALAAAVPYFIVLWLVEMPAAASAHTTANIHQPTCVTGPIVTSRSVTSMNGV